MNKTDVIAFFDRCAPTWDENMVRNESVIATILDYGGIREGIDVLDVACGTGVLFPDYMRRRVKSLTAIDISPQMVKIAQDKHPYANVICGDIETYAFAQTFDAVMVYNAFPHFPKPAKLVEALAKLLKPNGRLTIAHGMSREKLQLHHSGSARSVSIGLMQEDDLAELLSASFIVDCKVSDEEKYVVSGRRKRKNVSFLEYNRGRIGVEIY